MKEVCLDKSLFDNALGMSCVENLLIYIFKTQKITYKYLFFESALSAYDIVQALSHHKNTYSDFRCINRIQDLARNAGMIEICLLDSPCIPTDLNEKYCCIMVNPTFIRDNYRTQLLRDDHYVLLSPSDFQNYFCINDVPRDIRKLSLVDLYSYYGGHAIEFRIKGDFDYGRKEEYLVKLKTSMEKNLYEAVELPRDILIARDIVGILRILRKRLAYMISEFQFVECWKTYIDKLDEFYSRIEYMRLRNIQNVKLINDMWIQLVENDAQNIEKTIWFLKSM